MDKAGTALENVALPTLLLMTGDTGVLRGALQSWLHLHAPVQALAVA